MSREDDAVDEPDGGAEFDTRADFETAEGAPFACPHCGRPFAREDYRDLHLGLAHGPDLTDDEREAAEAALEAERHALRLFRYEALAALVVIYFGFIIVYAFAL